MILVENVGGWTLVQGRQLQASSRKPICTYYHAVNVEYFYRSRYIGSGGWRNHLPTVTDKVQKCPCTRVLHVKVADSEHVQQHWQSALRENPGRRDLQKHRYKAGQRIAS